MGSFRIVSGSGYGRHEVTDAGALAREFEKLKEVASYHPTPVVRAKKTRTTSSGSGVSKKYDKLWDDMVRKANKWARLTAAEMRASVPVDTGNLRDSIHVLEDECYRNKATGEILMVVGADLDPVGGQKKLYPPPKRKHGADGGASKYGRKTPPWQGYRIMPDYDPGYPEGYAAKFLGEGSTVLSERFKAISMKNAKKIMGK